MLYKGNPAYILLADGTELTGKSIGAKGTSIGEIVFATGMTAYQETLTDPSYYGQIVTQTFPLIGNYGVNREDFESDKSYVKGYIIREYSEVDSNFRSSGTIKQFLEDQNVICVYEIDTRALTRKIRNAGVMNGMISTEPIEDKEKALEEIRAYKIVDAVKSVSNPGYHAYKTEYGKNHVVLYDFGYKRNIREKLLKLGCNVTVVPYNTPVEEVKKLNPDGIMLSNGPGDPSECTEAIAILQEWMKEGVPLFGICLGHQLLALANGARSEKLKYGHRGANQPVIDIRIDRTFVTTQNHGYAIVADSIDPSVGSMSHKNANDGTCEGIVYHNAPAFSVQFHPEANGGPHDTAYLFSEFIKLMDKEGALCH